MEAVYTIDGPRAVPSRYAGGPWNTSLQHGGAPAGLIAWAAEAIPADQPMQVARLTIDLLRPVPVAPLTVSTEVIREGRKIQLCGVRLAAEGTEVVRASVLKIRSAQHALPPATLDRPLDVPQPDQCREATEIAEVSIDNPFLTGVSVRVAKGSLRRPGPASVWFRADRPIVQGAPISALMRAALTSDFSNGTATALDFDRWTFINGDLTISLARLPMDDWILVDAETWLGPTSTGIAFAKLADRHGYFGRAVQSLVVEPR
ncbi:thioesterase family protein [Reyranella sp. CPCC 100927]|uniref:thioesterase family protein n=1 Tax=Reyranella sp. CPCC 100927 TaxID=2599616 RepID=UPI0011B61B83|nr:thioesterase family protein [Reyranella sp. CPCC 100927]TWT03056.1 thioesterase family protein [Reyranella sp. CPCC 100927]